MKRVLLGFLVLAGLNLFPVEIVVFKDVDCINLSRVLDENDVLFYQVTAIDADENNHLYFLAHKLCSILKIDSKSGKLVKIISSKGQGPGELNVPHTLRVVNRKIFVPDSGFGGVKIFSIDGTLLKEFKTHPRIGWLDVNQKEEIFTKESEPDATPVIAVYDSEGKRQKTLIRFSFNDTGSTDRLALTIQRHFVFRLDSQGNILVLNNLRRILQKYDNKGHLIWHKRIENEILEKYMNREKKPYRDKFGNVRFRTIVRNYIDIDRNDNVVIGHAGGGMVFDKNGSLFKLIKFESSLKNLQIFRVFDNDKQLINAILWGDEIDLMDYSRINKRGRQ